MDLTVRGYRTLLMAACRKAVAEGSTVLEILAGMVDTTFGAALVGEGIFDITDTSNAGQSVSQAASSDGYSKANVGEAAQLLWQIGQACIAANPSIAEDSAATCAAISSCLPLRGARAFRSKFDLMHAYPGPSAFPDVPQTSTPTEAVLDSLKVKTAEGTPVAFHAVYTQGIYTLKVGQPT